MYIEDIEIIKVACESKSLSQAAEKLHMSRPSLSQKITTMECELHTQLFERTSQGVTPTRAGRIMAQFAQRVATMGDELEVELASLGESFEPDIVVGTSLADGVTLLPRMSKAFHDEHPDVKIHLNTGYEPELMKKLMNCSIDFALLEDRSMDSGFAWDLLGQEELIFVAPNTAPYNKLRQPVKYETLLPLPMIIYEWHSGRHMVGNRHFRVNYNSSLKDNNVVARMDTHEAMIRGVRAGLGWGSFPRCIWERYKEDDSIITLNVDTPPVLYDVSLVTVEDRLLSPIAEEFYGFVKENIPEDYFFSA